MGRSWPNLGVVLLALLPLAGAVRSVPAQRSWAPTAAQAIAAAGAAVVSLALYIVLYASAGNFKDEPRNAIKQARTHEGASR